MIDVRDVSRRFGRTTALSHATFSVQRGEIVALLGPNGAGKTTASRIIGGILAPSEGEAFVDGISVRTDPDGVRRRCGLVTDQPSLYERMPLRLYLEFFASLYDVVAPAPRIRSLCELLGLTDVMETRLGAFSRGMKQKAAIARGLVHDPAVLLLDEPATALDPAMARTLRDVIVSLRDDHRAILLCTHDLDEAQRIADRVVIVDRGRVVRTGSTAELRAAGKPTYVVTFAGEPAAASEALARAGFASDTATTGSVGQSSLRYATDDPAEANPRALRALLDAGVAVTSLIPEERSLEDAYFAAIGAGGGAPAGAGGATGGDTVMKG